MLGHALEMNQDEADSGMDQLKPWDVAIRYHELKTHKMSEEKLKALRRLSAHAILARAQDILGSVVHPVQKHQSLFQDLPFGALHAEIDLEETLEAGNPSSEIWMEYDLPRRQSMAITIDTSLSMTGEKLALTAVALAVVLLQFPEDEVGIVAFENEARVLKRLDEKISIAQLLERFLDVPAQGYTHLEDGLRATLGMIESRGGLSGGRSRPISAVLLTDGKYTAGRDPAYLAHRFGHLIVMKMGFERASHELCKEMATLGHGKCLEVGELETLPQTMYAVVKDILRGKSHSA